jgi:LPXTG-motif cell wall-anchored protein
MAMAIVVSLGMTLPASAQYKPMQITVNPTAVTSCGTDTGQITVATEFWKEGSTVTISLNSDPVVLGTLVADAAGKASATYNLPVGVTAGAHTVTATGTSMETGVATTLTASITVTVPPGCVSVTTVVQTTPSSGPLPVTGSDNGIFVAVGAGLLVAGGLLVMATRKRNAARA